MQLRLFLIGEYNLLQNLIHQLFFGVASYRGLDESLV